MAIPTLIKQPSESRLYSMNFAPNLEVGETVASVNSVVASPNTGITLSGPATAAGTKAFQRILGGTDGEVYKITFIVTTSLNNVLESEGYLKVKAL